MDVKLKSFDIRKPQVSIGTKPFLTVEKTVREMVGTAGSLKMILSNTGSKTGTAVFSEIGG